MSTTVTSVEEVPEAPYYVVGQDTFMSGWGPARNRENWVILPCEDDEEADVVLANAKGRSDISVPRVVRGHARLGRVLDFDFNLISLFDREDASAWYEPGRW